MLATLARGKKPIFINKLSYKRIKMIEKHCFIWITYKKVCVAITLYFCKEEFLSSLLWRSAWISTENLSPG